MKYQKQYQYWIASAERNWSSAKSMFKHKQYDWALFVGHLALEKLLKALIVRRTDAPAPPIHNLTKLAYEAGLVLDKHTQHYLETVTTFNIETRYDEARYAFYKRCTPAFTKLWLSRISTLRVWLKKELQKK